MAASGSGDWSAASGNGYWSAESWRDGGWYGWYGESDSARYDGQGQVGDTRRARQRLSSGGSGQAQHWRRVGRPGLQSTELNDEGDEDNPTEEALAKAMSLAVAQACQAPPPQAPMAPPPKVPALKPVPPRFPPPGKKADKSASKVGKAPGFTGGTGTPLASEPCTPRPCTPPEILEACQPQPQRLEAAAGAQRSTSAPPPQHRHTFAGCIAKAAGEPMPERSLAVFSTVVRTYLAMPKAAPKVFHGTYAPHWMEREERAQRQMEDLIYLATRHESWIGFRDEVAAWGDQRMAAVRSMTAPAAKTAPTPAPSAAKSTPKRGKGKGGKGSGGTRAAAKAPDAQ